MARTTWKLDPAHSSIEFSVKHMMITTVHGRFKTAEATVVIDDRHPEYSSVLATIEATSVDTGAPDRDTHLRSADFFDVAAYPSITFRSQRVAGAHAKEGDKFELEGELTIRDTTLGITLDCVFEGQGTDPWGNTRVAFAADGELDRRDWGLRWNQAIETGGMLVANKVRIHIDAQCVQQAEETRPTQEPAEQPGAHP
jgi:polyisoprenoid-binding protein YceI